MAEIAILASNKINSPMVNILANSAPWRWGAGDGRNKAFEKTGNKKRIL